MLEGTFFWEVVDIPKMLQFTSDAPGDVCAHARSSFISLVSKVTLREFMDTFNDLASRASSNDSFYENRGIAVHSLEVTHYACADASTSAILEQIIMETTNRMNRLSKQASENEVALSQIQGKIAQAQGRAELDKIEQTQGVESAESAGVAEAQRVLAFLQTLEGKTSEKTEDLWRTLRRLDGLQAVAAGNAQVYFTPEAAHLTIESRG